AAASQPDSRLEGPRLLPPDPTPNRHTCRGVNQKKTTPRTPPVKNGLGRHPVPQLHDPLAQLLLRLERRVDLLALAMPAFHRKVKLRGLQSRDLQITAQSRATEHLQPLLQALPRAGQDRHLVGQDRALSRGRLLPHLIEQVLPLIP